MPRQVRGRGRTVPELRLTGVAPALQPRTATLGDGPSATRLHAPRRTVHRDPTPRHRLCDTTWWAAAVVRAASCVGGGESKPDRDAPAGQVAAEPPPNRPCCSIRAERRPIDSASASGFTAHPPNADGAIFAQTSPIQRESEDSYPDSLRKHSGDTPFGPHGRVSLHRQPPFCRASATRKSSRFISLRDLRTPDRIGLRGSFLEIRKITERNQREHAGEYCRACA